jgi:hypothetical protein
LMSLVNQMRRSGLCIQDIQAWKSWTHPWICFEGMVAGTHRFVHVLHVFPPKYDGSWNFQTGADPYNDGPQETNVLHKGLLVLCSLAIGQLWYGKSINIASMSKSLQCNLQKDRKSFQEGQHGMICSS